MLKMKREKVNNLYIKFMYFVVCVCDFSINCWHARYFWCQNARKKNNKKIMFNALHVA